MLAVGITAEAEMKMTPPQTAAFNKVCVKWRSFSNHFIINFSLILLDESCRGEAPGD